MAPLLEISASSAAVESASAETMLKDFSPRAVTKSKSACASRVLSFSAAMMVSGTST